MEERDILHSRDKRAMGGYTASSVRRERARLPIVSNWVLIVLEGAQGLTGAMIDELDDLFRAEGSNLRLLHQYRDSVVLPASTQLTELILLLAAAHRQDSCGGLGVCSNERSDLGRQKLRRCGAKWRVRSPTDAHVSAWVLVWPSSLSSKSSPLQRK